MAGTISRSGENLVDRSLDEVSESASSEAGKKIRDLYNAAIKFLKTLEVIAIDINKLKINKRVGTINSGGKVGIGEIDSIFNKPDKQSKEKEDILRGRVYLAILEFEKVIYEIMNWELIFTFIRQDGKVFFANEVFLKQLYKKVGSDGKPTLKLNTALKKGGKNAPKEYFGNDESSGRELHNLRDRNEKTEEYFKETIERFNYIKELNRRAKQHLQKLKSFGQKISSTQVSQSYLYYIEEENNNKKYYFYNNESGFFQYNLISLNKEKELHKIFQRYKIKDEEEKMITHIEYLTTIKKQKKDKNGQKLPRKVNRGNISEGYARFFLSDEVLPEIAPNKEEKIYTIMSYMRSDNISQLYGGDVQRMIENHQLQFSIKSFDYSLANYNQFIVFAQEILKHAPNIKVFDLKILITKGHNGKINLTNAIEEMVQDNIKKIFSNTENKKI